MQNLFFSLLKAMLDRKEATIEVEPTASATDNTESEIARYITLYQEGKISAQKCFANIAWYMSYEESARDIRNMALLYYLEIYFSDENWIQDYNHNLDDFHIKNTNDGLKEIAKMLLDMSDDIVRFLKFKDDWGLNCSQSKEYMKAFNKHLTLGHLTQAAEYRVKANNLEAILEERTLTPKEAIAVIKEHFDVLYLNPRTYEIIMYFILSVDFHDDEFFEAISDVLRKRLI